MKATIYISLVLAGLLLPTSEEVRSAVVRLAKDVVHTATSMVVRGSHAEVRTVDARNYDDVVVKETKRIVVVVFDNKIRSNSRVQEKEFDKALRKLPNSVLVAKVTAEGNGELLKKLNVYKLPNVRIYKSGSLVRNFGSDVDPSELTSAVQNYLSDTSGRVGGGYIGPLEDDWLPQGVIRTSQSTKQAPQRMLKSK